MFYFITGNKNKFQEFQDILWVDEVQQLDIDLPEIQEIDPHKIITSKVQEALKHHTWPILIEDTSLYFDCLWWSLPWPLIKRFLHEMKNEWLYQLAKKYNNFKAKATVLIWYAKNIDEIEFFEGTIEWIIVEPIHTGDFGRGPIFQPNNYDKSYWAMSQEEKNEISMRRIALNKLKIYKENHKN